MNDIERGWRPLLTGARAVAAEAALEALALDLAALSIASLRPSLANGAAGVALFFDALHRLRGDRAARHHAERALEFAFTAAEGGTMELGLHFGVAGVAWVAARMGLADAIDDSVDEELLALVRRRPWRGDHDLLGGLVGIGVYALERCPRPLARSTVEEIVARLGELARRDPDGSAVLPTPAELLRGRTDDPDPKGHTNLGMAHGLPGAVAFLGHALALGVREAGPLLRALVAGLLRRRLDPVRSPGATWAAWIDDGADTARPARSGWCYGDPAIAVGLLLAARGDHDDALEALAIEVASGAASRPVDQSGVIDAGLCHGAGGLGHIYNRLWQDTSGEIRDRFGDVARTWIDRALALRRPDRGIGGFVAWDLLDQGGMGWAHSPGLLSGAAGVGLALCAALSSEAPRWDGALLLDVPPPSRAATLSSP